MLGHNPTSEEIHHLVERQLRQWEQEKNQPFETPHLADSKTEIDYIAISREFASGGDEIARALGKMLDWHVYDRTILQFMAEDMKVHKTVLESVDEGTSEWVRDWVTDLFVDSPLSRTSYCKHLAKVLAIIAKHKRAIIIGRCAGMILPRDRGLSIRITAPFDVRCRNYAKEKGISIDDARDYVKKQDESRRAFFKKSLSEDIDDMKHYDLVFNTEKLPPTAIAKLIWRCLDQRKAMPATTS